MNRTTKKQTQAVDHGVEQHVCADGRMVDTGSARTSAEDPITARVRLQQTDQQPGRSAECILQQIAYPMRTSQRTMVSNSTTDYSKKRAAEPIQRPIFWGHHRSALRQTVGVLGVLSQI
jgi:hypothetical protein